MMVYEEGHSSDYGTVGVQYLGKGWNGAQGTRFDKRKSESRYKTLDDRYITEDSEWKFKSTPTEQRQRIFFHMISPESLGIIKPWLFQGTENSLLFSDLSFAMNLGTVE